MLPLETTATCSYGYHPRTRPTTRRSAKMNQKTWRHGGSKQCAGQAVDRKYMIWLGRRMECSSSREAWTTLRGFTVLQMVGQGARHWTILVLITCRYDRQTDRRTQPLCARCCLGSSERVCCDTVFGQIGSHLHTQDERRPIQPHATQQSYQDGPPRSPHLLK